MANAEVIDIENESDVSGVAFIPCVVRPRAGDEDSGDLVFARTGDELRLPLHGLTVVAIGVVTRNCHHVGRDAADLVSGGRWRWVGQNRRFATADAKATVPQPVDFHKRSIMQQAPTNKARGNRKSPGALFCLLPVA